MGKERIGMGKEDRIGRGKERIVRGDRKGNRYGWEKRG